MTQDMTIIEQAETLAAKVLATPAARHDRRRCSMRVRTPTGCGDPTVAAWGSALPYDLLSYRPRSGEGHFPYRG